MKFPSVAIAFEAVFFRTFSEYEWQILLRNIILATENVHLRESVRRSVGIASNDILFRLASGLVFVVFSRSVKIPGIIAAA